MNKQKRKKTMRKPADKMLIVLKGMEPGIDMASLCRQEGISLGQPHLQSRRILFAEGLPKKMLAPKDCRNWFPRFLESTEWLQS
jgi:hypothetical protein